MKVIKTSVLLLLIVCLTAACSTENKADEEMTNNVALSVVGNAFMNEDDTEGITLHLLIAFAPTKDETKYYSAQSWTERGYGESYI